MLRRLFSAMLVASAGLGVTVDARANLIVNGSFEAPTSPETLPGLILLPSASSALTGWTISNATTPAQAIDVLKSGNSFVNYAAFEGSQFIDLNGLSPSTITQSFATTAGQTYLLSFQYADNYNGGVNGNSGVKTADVLLNGSTVYSLTHSTSGDGSADWQLGFLKFVAPTDTTTLTFTGTSTSNNGITLDAVNVEAVPEPASFAMLAGGILGVGFFARRRMAKPVVA